MARVAEIEAQAMAASPTDDAITAERKAKLRAKAEENEKIKAMAKEQNDLLLEVESEILAAKRARAAYRTVYKEEPEDFVD